MFVYEKELSELHKWIQSELILSKIIKHGSKGISTQRVQEWLTIHGYKLVIDGDFGKATHAAIERFQNDMNLMVNGVVDQNTFSTLTKPMTDTLQKKSFRSNITISTAMLEYAQEHLKQHPIEIGGQNRGPWVRMFMKGNQGSDWPWCAGFTTFLLNQASQTIGIKKPIDGSFSCDLLAMQAKNARLFLSEKQAKSRPIPAGSWFLNRRTSGDWSHVGLVVESRDDVLLTIEGNTNDDGSYEGYEVCERTRSYRNRDFIIFE